MIEVSWHKSSRLLKNSFSMYSLPFAAKEAAEKMTSAAKAADGNKAFIAALKRCATQNKIISAAC